MNVGFNQVTLIGTVLGEVELRHTSSGVAVATFLLDVPRDGQGAGREDSDSFLIILLGREAADAPELLSDQTPVCVQGRLQIRNWVAEKGERVQSAEVIAQQAIVLS